MRLQDMPTFPVPEADTPIYSFTLESIDEDGVVTPIAGSDVDTLTLTVVQAYTLDVVNGRDVQDVYQTNQVTIDEDGICRWALTADDSVILNDALEMEPHRALFRWTYTTDDGTRAGSHEVLVQVGNLVRPTA